MGIRLLFLILLLIEAPDLSGAFAQDSLKNNFSSLIKCVGSEKIIAANTVVKTDGIENSDSTYSGGIFDILDFLGAEEGKADIEGNNDTEASNILQDIINRTKQSRIKETSSEDVLDFMTQVYERHDFYQAGKWDDAEDYSDILHNVSLPAYNPDDFYRPVWGRITSNYGFRASFGRMHKGIDLDLNVGDTVRAALPGVVARVGYDAGGYGHFIVLLHNNGMETRYAHLQRALSSPGESLEAGEPLGLGGNTGNSTGPHLHFEIRYRGTAVDPASVFDFSNRSMRHWAQKEKR